MLRRVIGVKRHQNQITFCKTPCRHFAHPLVPVLVCQGTVMVGRRSWQSGASVNFGRVSHHITVTIVCICSRSTLMQASTLVQQRTDSSLCLPSKAATMSICMPTRAAAKNSPAHYLLSSLPHLLCFLNTHSCRVAQRRRLTWQGLLSKPLSL